MQRCGNQPSTGATGGVTKGNGTAIHIHLLMINTEIFLPGHDNRGKRFIDFKYINIL